MTIKEFSRLCGCNPQTLRYYDRVDLLKPAKVDAWSGYRFYDEEQAITFVRIKNLQKAGFTIEEIKELLERDDLAIFRAFEAKITEAERRLQEIKSIQRSYQTEMTDMKQKLETMRRVIQGAMESYDPSEEFGMDKGDYAKLVGNVSGFFEDMMSRGDDSDFEYLDDDEEDTDALRLLHDPQHEIAYEKHGWRFVKDFFAELSPLEDGREYVLLFHIVPEKTENTAFATTALGALLLANPKKQKRKLGCHVIRSDDGQNHFWLLRRKQA